MVDSNIIEPADEPTEWVNGIVIEKKIKRKTANLP